MPELAAAALQAPTVGPLTRTSAGQRVSVKLLPAAAGVTVHEATATFRLLLVPHVVFV